MFRCFFNNATVSFSFKSPDSKYVLLRPTIISTFVKNRQTCYIVVDPLLKPQLSKLFHKPITRLADWLKKLATITSPLMSCYISRTAILLMKMTADYSNVPTCANDNCTTQTLFQITGNTITSASFFIFTVGLCLSETETFACRSHHTKCLIRN